MLATKRSLNHAMTISGSEQNAWCVDFAQLQRLREGLQRARIG